PPRVRPGGGRPRLRVSPTMPLVEFRRHPAISAPAAPSAAPEERADDEEPEEDEQQRKEREKSKPEAPGPRPHGDNWHPAARSGYRLAGVSEAARHPEIVCVYPHTDEHPDHQQSDQYLRSESPTHDVLLSLSSEEC